MVNDCLDPGISNVITIVNEIVPLFSMWGFIVVIIALAVQVKANEQSSLFGFMTPDSFSLLISIHIHLHHFIAKWTVSIDSGINFHEQWLGCHWQCRRFTGNESIQNCKLGKAQSLQSEATQRSLPVVRLNLRVLRVRNGGEGFEVRWVEQRVSQVDVNPVYCVFNQSWFILMRCDDAHTTSCVIRKS